MTDNFSATLVAHSDAAGGWAIKNGTRDAAGGLWIGAVDKSDGLGLNWYAHIGGYSDILLGAATTGYDTIAVSVVGGLLSATLNGAAAGNFAGIKYSAPNQLGYVIPFQVGADPYAADFSKAFRGKIDTIRIETVPEPTSLALLGLGAAGVALRRRRNK